MCDDDGDLDCQEKLKMTVHAQIRLMSIIGSDRGELSILLSIAALLSAIGFVFGDTSGHNYQLIVDFADPYIWAILFVVYGYIKLYSVFNATSTAIRTINSVVGLWAWNYLFLCFVLFDQVPASPTEYLLGIAVIAEFWIMLAIPIGCKRSSETQR